MHLRWQSKPRFDASRPASGRLPAIRRHSRLYALDLSKELAVVQYSKHVKLRGDIRPRNRPC